MPRRFLASAAAALLLLVPFTLPAAFDLLAAVPAHYEVVATIDTRKVIDSPAFQKAWPAVKKPETDAQLALVKSLSGVDLLRDVDRVSLFTLVNNDDSVGVAFEGRFEEEKLLLLVKAGGTYKSATQEGITIHEWFDKGENRAKFAIFPEPGVLVIYNSRGALDASLKAMSQPAGSLKNSADARIVPEGADTLAGWGVLITRQQTCPGAKLRLASAAMTMRIEGEQLSTTMLANPEPDYADAWLDLARGTKALGIIQRDNEAVAEFARRVTVAPRDNGRIVEMSATVSTDELIQLARR